MKKPTISELEELLSRDEDLDIEIQPNGEIRAVEKGTAKPSNFKPLTFKYAVAEYF